jgi:hypothetical protein
MQSPAISAANGSLRQRTLARGDVCCFASGGDESSRQTGQLAFKMLIASRTEIRPLGRHL